MTGNEIFLQYQAIATQWKNALEHYSLEQLVRKPSEEDWSIGQVYLHIFGSALHFHGKQAKLCLENTENADGAMEDFAKSMFKQGSMPPDRIRVPPSPQYTPPQPENKEQILALIANVEAMMQNLTEKADAASVSGKTKHPRFGYVSATEWLQMIEMHFRHHLHQKGRIDEFLAAHSAH